MNYPATPALLNLISPMSGSSSGLGRSVHIRAVSQNIRHRWHYSFLYGNSETHLLLGAPRDVSLQIFYFGRNYHPLMYI